MLFLMMMTISFVLLNLLLLLLCRPGGLVIKLLSSSHARLRRLLDKLLRCHPASMGTGQAARFSVALDFNLPATQRFNRPPNQHGGRGGRPLPPRGGPERVLKCGSPESRYIGSVLAPVNPCVRQRMDSGMRAYLKPSTDGLRYDGLFEAVNRRCQQSLLGQM
jgi:hypothetical protein